MNMQLIQKIGKKFMKKVPVLKPGSTVKVHQRIKEGGKERVQIFEGLVIKINSGNGPSKTFTVRKMVGGIGVEKIFPVYSTNISKIQVIKTSDVRRSKLYYMRKRSGKSARLREKHLSEGDVVMEEIEGIGQEEEVQAEETAPTEEPTKVEAESSEATEPKEDAPAEDEAKSEPEAEPKKAEEEVKSEVEDKSEEPTEKEEEK